MNVNVLYAGGKGATFQRYLLTPFGMETKGFQLHNFAEAFVEGLRDDPNIKVNQMASWEVYKDFPSDLEELQEYDVVIIEEVEADIFYFHPVFYSEEGRRSEEEIVRPNRLEVIRKFVENGGGLFQVGGWMSFQGRFAYGQWHGTAVEEALPINFLDRDDRVETPEGSYPKPVKPDHPIMKDIPWDECPAFLGYNRAELKDDAELLANVEIPERGVIDPLIAVRDYGEGRTLVFTSDTSAHWGMNFLKWEHYQPFLRKAVKWLAKEL